MYSPHDFYLNTNLQNPLHVGFINSANFVISALPDIPKHTTRFT